MNIGLKSEVSTLLPTELARLPFLRRWLLWLALGLLVAAGLEYLPSIQPEALYCWAAIAVGYAIVGLYVPRLKNAGITPWLLLLLPIPVVNLFVLARLFFAPPKANLG